MDPDREVAERRIGHLVGGKWRLERLLGTGGMAAVYAATSPDGTAAAVKILHPEMTLKRDVRERFVREGYVGNKVQHAGAVRILEHGATEGEAFLVMELLDGEPLGQRVRRLDGLPTLELLGYLDQVLDVLAAAHEQGIIHRDIKPDNLFVTNDGTVKILDFGLARMLDDVPGEFKTRTGLALGTLPYMAPEQALGKRAQLDGRVDVFALGATAYRILSKRRVHEADSEAELLVAMATKPVAPLASVAPEVPPALCAIVDQALAYNKDARYPDARTMQADVRAVLAGGEPRHALAALSAGRDMPTRVDRTAPVVAATAAPVVTATAASGTAVMPATGLALPHEPTRVDGAAPTSLGPHSLGPSSLGPHSLPGYDAPPASAALAQTAYPMQAPAMRPASHPPPAKKSILPILFVLAGLGIALTALVAGALVLSGALSSEADPAAAATPDTAADAGAELAARPSPPTAAQTTGTDEPPASGAAENVPRGGPATKSPAGGSPTQPPAPSPAAAAQATGTSAPAEIAPRATAAPTATTAAPPPRPTAPPPPPPPSPATEPAPGGHGKGKDKHKDKGKGKDKHKDKDDD